MSRIIKPESAGKERTQLSRAVVIAIRELITQGRVDDSTRDLASFIALALLAISSSIDPSVEAWEKRGYWLKADRFRMEWAWTEKLGLEMKKAVLEDNWQLVALTSAQIMGKFTEVKVPQHHRLGTPWVGAWKKLQQDPHNS